MTQDSIPPLTPDPAPDIETPEVANARKTAVWILYILGTLNLLGICCMGSVLGGAVVMTIINVKAGVIALIFGTVLTIVLLALGITNLTLAFKIQRRSSGAAKIALIVSFAQMGLLCLGLLGSLAELAKTGNFIELGIQLLWGAAVWQLIVKLLILTKK
jgi:hypothetical protein